MRLFSTLRALLVGPSRRPFCNERTYLLWEPCSSSHAEVLPGFARYLLDLGYEVSVLVTPERLEEGLFDRFRHPRLHLNHLSQREARRHFRRNGLADAAGILVTTAGKLASRGDYASEIAFFGRLRAGQKVLLVEHDVQGALDRGTLVPEIITLRRMSGSGAATTEVNPHYFGDVRPHQKNAVARFATIGAMRSKRRNTSMLIDAVSRLSASSDCEFIVDLVGKGSLRALPAQVSRHLVVHGRVDFRQMYDLVAGADYLLPLLDPSNRAHDRYLATGTSGTFQLAYGFRKPCVIERAFARVHNLDEENSIIYDGNAELADAMREATALSPDEYSRLCAGIATVAGRLADQSIRNLGSLIQ